MKIIVLSFITAFLICSSGRAQTPIPAGASNFFQGRGGLSFSHTETDLLQRVAANRIDKVESGGGAVDWVEVDGRVFARAAWMIEIGEIANDFGAYDLERLIAAEMEKNLKSEGFRITPAKFDLNYVRYQKGSTIGTVEVRSFFLNSGNLPLRYEFIFNESYRPTKKSGVNELPKGAN